MIHFDIFSNIINGKGRIITCFCFIFVQSKDNNKKRTRKRESERDKSEGEIPYTMIDMCLVFLH